MLVKILKPLYHVKLWQIKLPKLQDKLHNPRRVWNFS